MSASIIHPSRHFLSVREAAGYLRVSKSFLDKLRTKLGGPPYVKIGSRVLYRIECLDAWVSEREFSNTHQQQVAKAG